MSQQEQLIVIRNPTGIEELMTYIQDKEYIAFDIETTGLDRDSEVIGFSICAEEDKAFYVILKQWTGSFETVIEANVVLPLLEQLKTKKLICHNGVFDCSMIDNYFKISLIDSLHTDTMILAHLLNENRRVGLKDLGLTIFGDDADKEAKDMKASIIANGGSVTGANYELYKADSELIARYGAKDALLTYKLFLAMVPELYEQGLDTFFYEEESMPLLKGPTYQMNTVGLHINTNDLMALKSRLKTEIAEAKAYIYQEIQAIIKDKYPGTSKKNTFNIGATQQLSWLLFGQLKLEFNTLTQAGKTACKDMGLKLPYNLGAKNEFITRCLEMEGQIQVPATTSLAGTTRAKKYKAPWAYIACDKDTLKKLAPRYKWIEQLLEYNKKNKLLSTYVIGVEERVKYGVIRPSFLQHGTSSGRYSSRNPNFQNLPRDDKRIKDCVQARPGKVFVGADYSQLEPRVFAYFSNDTRLLDAFKGEDDFYSVIGMEVYQTHDCIPRKDGSPDAFGVKYKDLRNLSKVIALASTYGATGSQLAKTTGKSVQDTQEDIDNYFEKFPGVKQMMLDSHTYAKKHGYVANLFGRKRRIPGAIKVDKLYPGIQHAELPYEARSLLNLSVNHRIQSTAASIVNRSAIRFFNNAKLAQIDCQMVCQVHDSLIIECNEADAESVSLLLQDAMENTIDLKTIQLEAIPKQGTKLSEV